MNMQILSFDSIVEHARKVAEAGLSVSACPHPPDSPAVDRWRIAFFGRERELRAEVEA